MRDSYATSRQITPPQQGSSREDHLTTMKGDGPRIEHSATHIA